MARSEFTKSIPIKFTINSKNVDKRITEFRSAFSEVAASFTDNLLGTTTFKSKLIQLKKDFQDLTEKRQQLLSRRKNLRDSDIVSAYDELNNTLEELQSISEDKRTEEQNKQLKEITQKIESLKQLRERYNMEGTSGYAESDELFEKLDELKEVQDELIQTTQDIRDNQKETKGVQEKAASGDKFDWSGKFKSSTKNLMNGVANTLSKAITDLGITIKKSLKNAYDEFKKMSSYSLSTSLTLNNEAREQALMYGLSDAQNYALTKAMEEMGKNVSVEDLYWMTPDQQERFSERIGYWSGKYNELANKDAFKKFEKAQKEIEDVQNDLRMWVVSFIADNKDIIIDALQFTADALKVLLEVVAFIANALSVRKSKEAMISDTINNYATNNNNSSNTNVQISNTYNGISADNVAKLRKAGNETNNQLIQALNGRS